MTAQPFVLINVLKVGPESQAQLLASLEANIRNVVSSLLGWRSSRLIAARDGSTVVIYSEWDDEEATRAMRSDPRMQAFFPTILALATFEATQGDVTLDVRR